MAYFAGFCESDAPFGLPSQHDTQGADTGDWSILPCSEKSVPALGQVLKDVNHSLFPFPESPVWVRSQGFALYRYPRLSPQRF